jgi:hypothetical protein
VRPDLPGPTEGAVDGAQPISISKFARDAAVHFLAQPRKYGLTDAVCKDLTEGVEGRIGRCDETAARRGLEWMREHYHSNGETPRF